MSHIVEVSSYAQGSIGPETHHSQVSPKLDDKNSKIVDKKDDINMSYMIHSSQVVSDLCLEEWQVEEEMLVTEEEEKRLSDVIRKMTEEQVSKLSHELERPHLYTDDIFVSTKRFFNRLEDVNKEHCAAREHLRRLVWLHDYYIPKHKNKQESKQDQKLTIQELDAEIAKAKAKEIEIEKLFDELDDEHEVYINEKAESTQKMLMNGCSKSDIVNCIMSDPDAVSLKDKRVLYAKMYDKNQENLSQLMRERSSRAFSITQYKELP